MVGIYKITNPKGRVYIGQSVNLEKRIKYYKYGYSKKQVRLHNSLTKYGYENHKFEILLECEVDELNDKERYFQELYDVLSKNGLNCELTSATNVRRVLSDESKRKIGLKNRGEKNGMYGKKMSDEFKRDRRNYKHTKDSIKKIKQRSHRGNNPNAKQVLCLETGIFYDCIGDAADALDISYNRLKQWLNGKRKNKSNMISL